LQGDISLSDIKEIILKRPRVFLPKQKKVFDLVFKENMGKNNKLTNNYVLYSGAFGAGKTILLAHVGIKAALDYPNSVGFVGSLSYPQMRDVVFRTFIQEIDLYQKKLDDNNIPIKLAEVTTSIGKMNINFYNGSEIWFRSCDNERNLAGKSIDWFGLDEPVDMKQGVMTQLIGRLRGTAMPFHFGMLATNPESETHWIYDYFYIEKKDGYFAVDTNTRDNILLPNQEQYIKDMENTYSVDWVRRYVDGKWGAFSGQIYKEFNKELHVKDFDFEKSFGNRKDLIDKFICGVDWGVRDATCILPALLTKNNVVYILEEYYETGKTSYEVAQKLLEFHKKYNFTKIYIDPSAVDLRNQACELNTPSGYFENGEWKSYADNTVNTGIAKLQSAFKNNKIVIHSSCINLIKYLLAYRYKGDGETPLKENDHAPDTVRYLVSDYNPILDDIMFGCGHWFRKRMN
jgi:PBSX family phage terminase large subunit